MMKLGVYHCPSEDIDCPYYQNIVSLGGKFFDGVCGLSMEEGGNPQKECDDFYFHITQNEDGAEEYEILY